MSVTLERVYIYIYIYIREFNQPNRKKHIYAFVNNM